MRKFNLTGIGRHYRRNLLLQFNRQVTERMIEYFNICYQEIGFLRGYFHFIRKKTVVTLMSSKKQFSISTTR